jgi:hypothetical protein
MPPASPVPYVTKLRKETIARLIALPQFPRVYDSRLPQLKRELLPALRVYTNSANYQGRSISIPDFKTTAHLIIQVICEDITDALIAERMDLYCELVKVCLMSDGKWLQLFERLLTIDIEIDRSVEGEWRLTTATIDFALEYSCSYEPVVPDWLQTVGMQVDVIDPAADPNTGPPGTPPNVDGGYVGGYPGPDGRIEVEGIFNTIPPVVIGNIVGINKGVNPLLMLDARPLDQRIQPGALVWITSPWPSLSGRWLSVLDVANVPLSQFHLADVDTTNEAGIGTGSVAVSAIPAPLTNRTARSSNGLAKGK